MPIQKVKELLLTPGQRVTLQVPVGAIALAPFGREGKLVLPLLCADKLGTESRTWASVRVGQALSLSPAEEAQCLGHALPLPQDWGSVRHYVFEIRKKPSTWRKPKPEPAPTTPSRNDIHPLAARRGFTVVKEK